ncbi:AraC-like ligand binding domain-containing protein [Gracilibacillus orientalis]|uniref:AraC-like ligand binding domain-containing protein n=1 Tax=Gracilibacillus orientalis TaxID=334253 RepID=A0A1I4HTU8_9BACI|nr:helix-turn-helix domain-containing protein [Gracilibacillus orientalis]SFL45572.1 AraC-like ligand binding domain-containing protein [Gracilibacillus orientalis]
MAEKVNVSLRNRSFYIDYSRGYENSRDMKNYHLHQDYEIFYLLEGEKVFLINGEKFVAIKDTIMLIDKNILHKTIVNDHKYQRIVLNFRDCFLLEDDQILLSTLFKRGPLMLSVKNPTTFQMILEKMLEEYHMDNTGGDRYLQLLLSQFLIECKRLICSHTSMSEYSKATCNQHELIDGMITYINERFHQDITLSILADKFFLHEQSISKLFKQSIGCSFTEYMNAVRITEAKRLLTETNLKINQITKKVGYTNHVHFWRIFKKFTGMSPNNYREQEVENCKRFTIKA